MSNLGTFLLILHVLLALGIITLVLLQKGKGAAEGAAFGGGASASVFGASGSSNFLSKSTAICATLFFLNSEQQLMPIAIQLFQDPGLLNPVRSYTGYEKIKGDPGGNF